MEHEVAAPLADELDRCRRCWIASCCRRATPRRSTTSCTSNTAAAAATQRPAQPAAARARHAQSRPRRRPARPSAPARRTEHEHHRRPSASSSSTPSPPPPRLWRHVLSPKPTTRSPSPRSRCTCCSHTSHPSPSIHRHVLCPIARTPTVRGKPQCARRAARRRPSCATHTTLRRCRSCPVDRRLASRRCRSTSGPLHRSARCSCESPRTPPARSRTPHSLATALSTTTTSSSSSLTPLNDQRKKTVESSVESRRLSCLVSSSPPVLSSCPDQFHLAPDARSHKSIVKVDFLVWLGLLSRAASNVARDHSTVDERRRLCRAAPCAAHREHVVGAIVFSFFDSPRLTLPLLRRSCPISDLLPSPTTSPS